MGIGHAAVALGASRAEPRINVGLLVFAAFLADFLLGIFAAFGLERAHVPADFSTRHYLRFTFPYSHGMAPLLVWGILLGALLCWLDRRDHKRAFMVVAARWCFRILFWMAWCTLQNYRCLGKILQRLAWPYGTTCRSS